MVKVDTGKRAVWEHCKEAGISEDIARISSFFDIKDICVIYGGKMTYIEQRPRKMIRIAVATKPDRTVSEYMKETKERKR